MDPMKKMSKKEFEKEITEFKNCKDLHYFLMNILNLILHNGYFYCFCEKFGGPNTEFSGKKMCALCLIPMIFFRF